MERYIDIKVAATMTVKVTDDKLTEGMVLREIINTLTTRLELECPDPAIDIADISIDKIYLDD